MKTNDIKKHINNPWYQWTLIIIILLIIISTSSSIRTSNLNMLKDQTSGDYIPLALDPFYFLRVAQTYLDTGGNMPEYDEFRYNPGVPTAWHNEIMPYVVVSMYKAYSTIDPTVSLAYMDVISPVIFFIIALVFFFILCTILTKNKWIAILATAFLAFTPAYLYRTMAGFSDHESIGMLALFIAFTVFILAIKNLGRKKTSPYVILLWGMGVAFTTGLTIASWGGVARFIFIIFPITLFLIWLFNIKNKNKRFVINTLVLYSSWIILTPFMGVLLNQSFQRSFNYFLTSQGIVSIGIFAFIVVDAILYIKDFNFIKKKYRILYSLAVAIILGLIALTIMGRDPFMLILNILRNLIIPFGTDRLGLTVAENQAPYLGDWINQTGNTLFWMFYVGLLLFGYQLMKKIKTIKSKIIFLPLYILMISGILFSKYSPTSILNGESFISILVYFIPLIAFWIFFFRVYFKEGLKWSYAECFIFGWMFFTLISGRAAARMFFPITPFVCFMAAYLVIHLILEWKLSKDKTLKLLFIMFFAVSAFASASVINTNYKAISSSARYTGPSAHIQWQEAMNWVRQNTSEDSTFVHWWDYGYWIETLGKRRTVADGGHFQEINGDHNIGRYVLTTPDPNTALSFFKTMNIDYLLIDPTDLGKYSAYSKIGGDDEWDRFSVIPVGVYDPRRIQETNNQTIRIYNVQGAVDADIEYDSDSDGKVDIFLPGPTFNSIGVPTFKSYLGGVFFKQSDDLVLQPEGAFFYNNKQYDIPIRYVYVNGQLYDFKVGLESVITLVPSISTTSVDPMGAMIYLSPKVSQGLYAQLYLLDDAFENYPTIKVAHSEQDPVVKQLEAQGFDIGETVFYNGLRGPIKIWDTQDIPENINVIEEFYKPLNGNFAGLDDLEFITN